MLKYGLKHKVSGNIIKWIAESHGTDVLVDAIFILKDTAEGNIWMVDSEEQAKKVSKHSSGFWLDADYENPQHTFKPEELEFITIELTIK